MYPNADPNVFDWKRTVSFVWLILIVVTRKTVDILNVTYNHEFVTNHIRNQLVIVWKEYVSFTLSKL